MNSQKNKNVQIVAVDLDGTLLNSEKKITQRTYNALVRATGAGIVIVPATGRHYNAVPSDVLDIPGIRYIMGMSGAAIYDNKEKVCIHTDEIPKELAIKLIKELRKYNILIDVLLGEHAYRNEADKDFVDKLAIPDKMKEFVKNSRETVPDILELIMSGSKNVSKIILNFLPDGKGGCLYRDEIIKLGSSHHELSIVSGGLNNLEITMSTANKGAGLLKMAQLLNIPKKCTMAIGDAGNDADMIIAAEVGIAMANAEPEVLKIADYITSSNDEDGVAKVLEAICD